jgi:hypothetical protein
MAAVIQPGDLGNDQNNQNGQGPNSVNQAGQQTSTTSNTNQAGQAPVQNQSAGSASTSNSGSTNTGQSAGQSAGNQATGFSNAGTAGSNNQYNPNKQQGSGYTNIQQFVNANKGNQLGSAIGNNIQNTETSAQSNLANAQNQFQQQTQANQANTQGNQQLAQNVLADPTAYANIAGATQNSPTNAQAGQQFQSLLSGQYQGPTALTNASQLQNQAANVAQMGQALSSSGGQQGLLQQLVGNPQYTQGESGLDTLLLGQSNSPALQAAKRNALTLQGQTNSAITGAAAQGQQNTAQAQQFGTALQNQLGQTVTNENNQLQQAATNDQNQRNQQYQSALADLQSGNVNQNEAQLLGLTQGENVYNVLNGNGATGLGSSSAAQFLQENPLAANISNTANAQQYAQMQALQSLAGQYAPSNAQAAFQNFQNPGQASAFQNSQALIGNQAGLQNAINAAATNYGSIYNPAAASQSQAQNIVNDWGNTSLGTLGQRNSDIASLTNGGATGGSIEQNVAWANNNLATQNAALAAAQAQLQGQYGNLGTINIQPSAYPGIQAVQGNQVTGS